MLDSLNQIDNQILLQLNHASTPFWDCFMWTVSAKETWYVLYLSLLFVLWKNFSLRTTLIILLTITATIVFTDQICASLIRPFAERMRPSNPDNPISKYVYIVNGYRGGKYGLPSCHSANTFGLTFMIILILRNKLLGATLLFWACLNSYSRIHLGVHYMGDIICGMLVALVGSILIYRGMKYMFRLEAVRSVARTTDRDVELINTHKNFAQVLVPIGVLMCTIMAIAMYSQFLR